ncbi:protein TRANSPORT INHIBITOR RESPONSE 1-like [Capsicum annuum]|uniref:protein TRANSPORT INHIBITOR RESPONSE 1-like n=1 Tax=Capsicum annuum TaxID=4072 RepID=UPI001FB1862D|nr:protein TRANSPORT INHIBITOR RESPONSE 1-like [Capsicum annuum]
MIVGPLDFHFPSNLKILSLWDFPLTSDSLSTIAKLPNLKELFLRRTIIGEEWNMGEEDTFENLKFLYLDEVTLAKWEFGEESFPVLEKLELWGCHKLTEIPPNFGDIGSLKIIKLVKSPQLEDSALEITQYVEDNTGVDKLQILGPNDIPLSKTGSSLLFFCLQTKFMRVVYNVFDEFSIELFVNVNWLNFVTGAYFAGVQADPDRVQINVQIKREVRGYVDEIGVEDISTYCKNNLRAFPYAQEPNVSLTERGLVAISAGFSKIHSVLYFCCKMTNATASSPWRSETVPSGTRLVVNAARLETKWYLWMSSCSVYRAGCNRWNMEVYHAGCNRQNMEAKGH